MRYAVTFTIDKDWNSVDTIIVEADVCPLDMTFEQLFKIFKGYGLNEVDAECIASNGELWFCRNLEDTDVYVVGKDN